MTEMLRDDALNPELPHSLEAEQAVLGALMLDNGAFEAVAAQVFKPGKLGRVRKPLSERCCLHG